MIGQETQAIPFLDAVSVVAVAQPPPVCVAPPSGLVSWWPGEGNGTDATGGNDAILLNGVGFAQSEVGQGFSFDGLDDRVIVSNAPSLNFGPGADFSIEAWIQPLPAVTDFGVQSIVDKRFTPNFTAAVGYEFGLVDGKLSCQLADAPLASLDFSSFTAPGPDLRDGQFHHVAMAVERAATNGGKLYVDGQVVLTFDPTVQPGDLSTTEPLRIGNHADPALNSHFKGRIDEVAIYNRALSSAEIQSIYNAGSAGKCLPAPPPPPCIPPPAGLVSWWQAQSNALDSADGNNGTLQNGATFAAGKVGQAFSLDGLDDVVTVADAPNLRFGPASPMTVDMWVFRASSNPVQHMIGKRAGCTGSSIEGTFQLALNTDTGEGLAFGNPSGSCACSGQGLPLNSWTHLAGTFDGTTLHLFINGQLAATTAGSLGPANTAPLKIGDSGSCGAAYGAAFAGLIDEVSIYNRALSTNEIQAIYNAGSAGKCVVSNPPPVSPVILSQPTNVTVYVGSNATFRVTAAGDAPLSYQWRFDDHDLPGKTSSVLSLTSVQFSNAGPYSVVVSNAGGSIISSNAVLTVNPLPDCAPPLAGLVSWWRAENDATDNWDSNNGTQATPVFFPGKVGQAFFIRGGIRVTDSASLRLTNAVTLEAWVNPSSVSGTPPRTIISKFDYPLAQPVGTQSAYLLGTTNNGLLFFTVSATGSARTNTTLVTSQALSINQWSFVVATYDGTALRLYLNGTLAAQTNYSDGIFPGTASVGLGAIPFGTSFVWPFSGLLDEVSLYNRALTDGEIQAIYNADVVGKCLVAPSIVTQPQDQAIPLGEDVKFTVSVLGTRPLKYQWRFNGTNLANATNSALVLEKLQTNRVGNYSVFLSNAVGTATSSNAALTLLPLPTCTDSPAGLISWWPGDGNSADAMGTNNAKLFSPALYVTGKVDRAFGFNGISSGIDLSSGTSLNFGSNADFSIEMWIKAGASNTVYPNVPLFEKRDGSTSWIGYSLSLNQGRLAFAMGSSPVSDANVSRFISPGPDLRDAMFHHVAVRVNRTSTNGGSLYVDGQLVLTFDPTPRKGSLVTGASLYIGAPATTISNSYFGGLIDEPAIYNRALTAEEILAIRQAGAAGKCKVKPAILVQPVGQRVTVGSNVTFSVVAAGAPLLRYQWLAHTDAIRFATNPTYTFTVLSGDTFSVRVTNLFGSVVSSNAVLTVNHVPTVLPQTVSLNEDTPTPITLGASDPDRDPLSYPIITPPVHGALSGTGSNVVYTPNPNYNGPDSFTFKVNDGLVDSAPATVNLTILPVNDPPVAVPQSLALNEDTTATITLGAFDVEGDALTFAVGMPAHGTLTGTPPNLTYQPNTNYFGPDGFTFKVNDGQVDSTVATVSINVISVNDTPVAQAAVSPLAQFPGLTNLVVISPNNTSASVVLDGSLSTDVENDPLQYSWLEGTNVIATGVVATNILEVGTHTITLAVSDGMDTGADTVTVEVITPAQAVGILISLINEAELLRKNQRPLIATVKAAAASFDAGRVRPGINQLGAFQNKVRAQIAPLDQALADNLINAAQVIIDALSGP